MQRRRLLHPLTGSDTWVDGGKATHIVRSLWGGRSQLPMYLRLNGVLSPTARRNGT
jgi:hypothetical protein